MARHRALRHRRAIPLPIPELTAVHFHYAGFAASTLASLVVVRLSGVRRWRLLAAATSLLVVAGSPIVASGFVSGIRPLLAVGAVLIAVGLIGAAALMFFLVVPAMERRSARWLLRLSSVSVLLPMVLAVQWSAGPLFRIPTLDIQAMAAIHGDLNALGFTLPGLLGWTIEMAGRRKGAARGSLRAHGHPAAAS